MDTLKKLLAIGLLCGLGQTASALPTTWVDPIDFNPDVYLDNLKSFSYQHDITDSGFNAGTDDVYSYSLALNLFDDASGDWLEVAYIDLPGLFGDRIFFDLSGLEYGGTSVEGYAQLESTGKLNVTVASLGDFFIGSSLLTVQGNSGGDSARVAVPEPGTLALMGLGLLGVAFSRKKTGTLQVAG